MFCIDPDTGEIDAGKLAEEVNRAEDFRRKHTARAREITRRYIGNWYRTDSTCDPTPENLVAAYVAFMMPELSYSAPSCRIESKRPTLFKDVSDAMEQGMQGWLQEFEFTEEHQEVTRDFLINFGVMKVGVEMRDGRPDGARRTEALLPFAVRVPADQFIMDPRCEAFRYARYTGHVYFKDLAELQADPERWPADAVGRLTTMCDDEGSTGEGNVGQERAVSMGVATDRNRVCLADIWIPELNQIVTLARAGAGKDSTTSIILRQAPYHGPLSGPYELFGAYTVPGDPYPISPLQFSMEQFEELQQHLATASDAASEYKRFVVVDAAATDLSNGVMNAMNGSVVPVRGFNAQNMMEVQLGGPHAEMNNYIALARDRFDRTIGMSDAQRGRVQGKTATETQITQSNVDGRTQYLKTRIAASTRRVLEKVGWYLFYDPNVVLDVATTNPMTGETTEGLFLGGVQQGQEQADWVHFNLTIHPESMSRTDDQVVQQRALQLLQLAPQAAQMMISMPWVNVRWLVDMVGEAMNIKKLSAIMFNQQMLQQLQQIPALFGQGPTDPATLGQGGAGVNPQLLAALMGMAPQGQTNPALVGPGAPGVPGPAMGAGGGFGSGMAGGGGGAPAAGNFGAMLGVPPMAKPPAFGAGFNSSGFAQPQRASAGGFGM